MIRSASTHAMIAVKDLDRAREFYSGVLGLVLSERKHPRPLLRYEASGGTSFVVYPSELAGAAQSTCMRFEVDDVSATVKELRERGVVFEEYDIPGAKFVDGVYEDASGARGAWFKDPDGNILQIAPAQYR